MLHKEGAEMRQVEMHPTEAIPAFIREYFVPLRLSF
jgi:hypothetical protein